MHSQFSKAALVAGSLLAAVLAAELVLRLWQPHAAGLNRQPLIYERDATTGYRYRPNASGRFTRLFEFDRTVTINSSGLHDEERRFTGDERVIVAVGDSFTAAMHVPILEGWPRLLESYLRLETDANVRVVNLGLDGTGPDVQLELLREHVATLRPELVLLGFFANDRADILRRRVYREVHAGYVLQYQREEDAEAMRRRAEELRAETLRWWLFERSFLYRFGVYLASGDANPFRSNVMSPAQVGGQQHWQRARALGEIVEGFLDLGRSEGFALVVVPVPPRSDPEGSLRLLRRYVSIPGLRVIDLVGPMREIVAADGGSWQDLYFERDAHFGSEGNRVFARALADALAGSLVLAPDAEGGEVGPAFSSSSKTNPPRAKTR